MPVDAYRRMPLVTRLSGGNRRSIGQAGKVAEEGVGDTALLAELIGLMNHDNEVVRMRSADALEKVSRERPDLLQEYALPLLELFRRSEQQEVRWHLVQLLPRLSLTPEQRRTLFESAHVALQDRSRIVAVGALSALFALAGKDIALRNAAIAAAEKAVVGNAPAIRARARKLLASFKLR